MYYPKNIDYRDDIGFVVSFILLCNFIVIIMFDSLTYKRMGYCNT